MFAVPYNLPPSLCMKYEFMFFASSYLVWTSVERRKMRMSSVERKKMKMSSMERRKMRKMRMRVKRGITRLN
jgi:hypothetical protein